MAKDAVPRNAGSVVARGTDQLAPPQILERALHGAFGKAGRFREHAQTRRHRSPFGAGRLAEEMQINKIRSRLAIVPNDVAHQDINDVVVDRNGFVKTRHALGLAAIPINGQHFLALRADRIWTQSRRRNYVGRIMIKQIKFVSIPVADQNRALDFYTEKLGFTIITDQPFDEKQRWIELRVPKAETRVVLFTAEGDEKRIGSFMNMSYACDDIDKTYKELSARGVEFEGPPQKQPWGTYAMFKDSEGNRFVVSS